MDPLPDYGNGALFPLPRNALSESALLGLPSVPKEPTDMPNPAATIQTTCRICGQKSQHPAWEAKELLMGTRESFPYFQCVRCGCLQIADIPKDLGRHYPAGYYSYTGIPEVHPLRRRLACLRSRYAISGQGWLGALLYAWRPFPKMRLLRRLNLTKSTRILDIGCGAGAFLHLFADMGFQNLLGADPFLEHDLAYDNGLKILKRDIHEIDGEWDLVMFHHSFEHVPDAKACLQAAARRLVPGGTCLIRIPTASYYAWEHYGVDWVQLDAPRHLYLHSRQSLALVAAEAGLKVEVVEDDSGAFQFWGSEKYRQGLMLNEGCPWTRRELAAFEKQARILNAGHRGDQAAFFLRKPYSPSQP